MSENLNKSVKNATKWSAITEIASKLLTPIVSMVLARVLAPEAFGVVATLTVIITFAEIFTDAGFQKYLVQHQFLDECDFDESTNVAFWSNLVMSLLIWGVIILFSEPLAAMVGSPGLGKVLIISCVSIPLAAFSSIQMAIYRRSFDFKTLFKVRVVGILIPLVMTIPLAFWLRSYWALVLGTIAVNVTNAILLTMHSKWKPRPFYSFEKLKEMFSFTVWSLIESLSIWLTSYIDIFIVGSMLNQYYLGLYQTSSALVGQIMGLITLITTPILFSALSRLQDDDDEFQQMFFRFQKIVSILVLPLGVGMFLFSDLVTMIILGEQWFEANGFVGLWALTSGIAIVLSHYSSEVYRAKGKPKLSVLVQVLHIIVLWPVVLVAVRYGFETLYISRSIVRLELILVNLIVMWNYIKISPIKMIKNVLPAFLASCFMGLVYCLLPKVDTITINFAYVGVCGICYLIFICLFKEERKILLNLKSIIKR